MSNIDLLILLGAFLVLALLWGLFYPPGFFAWLREEIRLARAPDWSDGAYRPGTIDDPDVAYMAVRQRAMAKRMRRQGRSLLGPKSARAPWVPGPHVLNAEPSPDNVVPLRVAGGKR